MCPSCSSLGSHSRAVKGVRFVLIAASFIIPFIIGCGPINGLIDSGEAPTRVVTKSPTDPARTASIPTRNPPTSTLIPGTGWKSIRPGLDRRVINIPDAQGDQAEILYILRFSAKDFLFKIATTPEPQSLKAWRNETNALVVMNGGYFRVDNGKYIPTGLVIVNGKATGSSYGPFAGMFAVTTAGPELRWLSQKPYKPGEPILFALQSFPMLVKPGGVLGFPAQSEDNEKSRRTVVAQDKQGRVLFIVAPFGYFTLHRLSAYLTSSDLGLNIAINLDGGTSSGILLADPEEEISTLALLPIVMTVNQR